MLRLPEIPAMRYTSVAREWQYRTLTGGGFAPRLGMPAGSARLRVFMRNTPGTPPGDLSATPNTALAANSPQATGAATSVALSEREQTLLAALRRGDEQAFAMLVDEYSPSLLRVASLYVSSRAVAEDVVQETWIGVLGGLDRFEGRSTLKTWIFRILVNISK